MKMLTNAHAKLSKRRASDEGFTLIELVIVIAIIGILTAIAIPSYGAIQNTARENSVKAAATDGYTAGLAALANAGGGAGSDDAVKAAVESKTDAEITVTVAPATGIDEQNLAVTATWAKDTKITATKSATK